MRRRTMFVKLDAAEVERIFKESQNQKQAADELYRLVFPDCDSIGKIHGYPRVSQETSVKLFEQFIAFDREHHPDVLPGGYWMNCGFSGTSNPDLAEWTVDASRVRLHRQAA
jgi:hypothetical protein